MQMLSTVTWLLLFLQSSTSQFIMHLTNLPWPALVCQELKPWELQKDYSFGWWRNTPMKSEMNQEPHPYKHCISLYQNKTSLLRMRSMKEVFSHTAASDDSRFKPNSRRSRGPTHVWLNHFLRKQVLRSLHVGRLTSRPWWLSEYCSNVPPSLCYKIAFHSSRPSLGVTGPISMAEPKLSVSILTL